MSDIRAQKKAFRRKILETRDRLEPQFLENAGLSVFERLKAFPFWQKCRKPFIYISSKPGEVDTLKLIGDALATGKEVSVPVLEGFDRRLNLARLESLESLAPGPFDILEPPVERRSLVGIESPDLIVVPGLAFTAEGKRLGFGGGYYDRLLAVNQSPRIALAFEWQIEKDLPTDEHDIPVDFIVSEKRLIATDARGLE